MPFDYNRWKQQQFNRVHDSAAEGGIPTTVSVIGITWVAVGVIQILTAVTIFLSTGDLESLIGLVALGWMHLLSGLQTLSGTAPGTARNGLVSIFFGLAWMGVASLSARSNPNAPLMILGVGLVGFALVSAGVLALASSANYQRWSDPQGSAASTGHPGRHRRFATSSGGFKDAAPKPFIPPWGLVLAGCVGMVIMLVGGAAFFTKSGGWSGAGGTASTAKQIFERGNEAWANKDYNGAVTHYTEYLGLNTGSDQNRASAFHNRGSAYSALKQHANAVADFTEAIRLDPRSHSYAGRGKAFGETKEYAKAVEDFNQALRLDPKSTGATTSLAWMLATCPRDDIRDGKRAFEFARRACELSEWRDSNDIENLAAAYAECGDFAHAAEWQRRAIKLGVDLQDGAAARARLKLYEAGKPYRDK